MYVPPRPCARPPWPSGPRTAEPPRPPPPAGDCGAATRAAAERACLTGVLVLVWSIRLAQVDWTCWLDLVGQVRWVYGLDRSVNGWGGPRVWLDRRSIQDSWITPAGGGGESPTERGRRPDVPTERKPRTRVPIRARGGESIVVSQSRELRRGLRAGAKYVEKDNKQWTCKNGPARTTTIWRL